MIFSNELEVTSAPASLERYIVEAKYEKYQCFKSVSVKYLTHIVTTRFYCLMSSSYTCNRGRSRRKRLWVLKHAHTQSL